MGKNLHREKEGKMRIPEIGEEVPDDFGASATRSIRIPEIGEEVPDSYGLNLILPEKIEPKTTAEKIGRAAEFLPTAGAVLGGGASLLAAPGTMGASLLGGSALAALGASAGKAGEQIIKRVVGQDAPKTVGEAALDIGKEGVITGVLNATFAKIIPIMAPAFKKIAPGVLKALQGLDERATAKVLSDPDILARAKPIEEAEKIFSGFFEKNGFAYGPKAVKATTGKVALGDQAADDLISNTIAKIEAVSGTTTGKVGATQLTKLPENQQFVKETVQEALAARYSIGDAVQRALKSGNNSKARVFIESKHTVDDWIETQLPGFSAVRKVYEEAKIKQAFCSIWPKNKNGTTSVLRGLGALATGGTGNLWAAPLFSPLSGQAAIRGAQIATKAPVVAGAAQIAGQMLPEVEPEEE
jgi:hypothetical protein